jgi:hypothetical protein
MTLVLKLDQRGVQRPVVNQQGLPTDLLDAARNPIPVLRAHSLERPQDHEREGALPDVLPLGHLRLSLVDHFE